MAEGALAHEVSAESFAHEVIEASKMQPIVVDFWAPWCGPCRMLGPVLDKVVASYAGKVVLAKVNVDEHQTLAAQYRVLSIPSVKAFKNGEMVSEFVGFRPEPEIRQWVAGLLK
jgi:putative thioredoxin